MFRSIATAYREAFSGLSRPVWLLSIATLVNRSGTMVMPFLALFLTEKRGFTTTQAGQTLALYGLGAMGASYLGGWLCDRISPLRVMKWSLALTGVCFMTLGHLQGRLAISAMMLVLSFVGEIFRPANLAALVAASDPGERGRSFALMRLAVNLGMTLGPTLGGFLALRDYGLLFVADGATCLLAAGLLQIAFPGAGLRTVPRSAETRAKAAASSPWRDRHVLGILGLMFLLNVVTFQLNGTFPLTLRHLHGLSEARIGLALATNTVLIVLFEMVLVHSLSSRNPLKVSGVGAFLFCAGLALLPLGRGFGFVVFTVAVWTVGEMLVFPIVSSAVADRAPRESQGAYMGLLNLSFASAFVVAPLVGTWVYQNLGPATLWYGCGAVGLAVWAGFQGLAVRTSRPARVGMSPAPPTLEDGL
jgi:predicted MFS family arabinose efflux permease